MAERVAEAKKFENRSSIPSSPGLLRALAFFKFPEENKIPPRPSNLPCLSISLRLPAVFQNVVQYASPLQIPLDRVFQNDMNPGNTAGALSQVVAKKIPGSPKEYMAACARPLLFLLVAIAFLSMWHVRVTHGFSLRAVLVFAMLCSVFLIYGHVFFRFTASCLKFTPGLAAVFLCGYFIFSSLGFLLGFLTHLTMAEIALILSVCAIPMLWWTTRPRPGGTSLESRNADFLPQLLCLIFSGLGATLWCADSLRPAVNYGEFTTYQMWIDCFFHVRQISIFSQSHGLRDISHIQMAGAPASVYHYAGYFIPAAISSLSGTHSYEVFASFLTPFGILLTGLAAFTLTCAIWGPWPGLAAVVAVLFLPDAYQQGFQNKFLGYNFLQQANPGGLYGVALIAIAWMFVLDGCKTGRKMAILFGYVIALLSVVYKAQIFVANAFLIMIYPCLFFRGLKVRWRLIVAIGFITIFLIVVYLSQYSKSIPTLRMDGSSSKPYALLLLKSFDSSDFMSFYYLQLTGEPPAIFDLIMAFMIMLSTFGAWIILSLFLFFLPKARPTPAARFFPILVILNYIIMAVGLAGDSKGVGMPEELSHRPLVWAYFAVVACAGASVYFLLIGTGPPGTLRARFLTGACALCSILFPFIVGHNIQTMPAWPGYEDYRRFNSLPTGFVRTAAYLRENSACGDIIQDSENDPRLALTALAEKQDFIAYGKDKDQVRNPEGLKARVKALDSFRGMKTMEEINGFARKNLISWYLLHPETTVAWPELLVENPVFSIAGYRVYHFDVNSGNSPYKYP